MKFEEWRKQKQQSKEETQQEKVRKSEEAWKKTSMKRQESARENAKLYYLHRDILTGYTKGA